MKLEVGMHVKFKTLSNEVKIGQIQLIDNSIYELDNNEVTADKYIIKASHNIIDLIEVGDYVNGLKVYEVRNDIKGFGVVVFSDCSIHEWQISSIVTKEQFESMSYKVSDVK